MNIGLLNSVSSYIDPPERKINYPDCEIREA